MFAPCDWVCRIILSQVTKIYYYLSCCLAWFVMLCGFLVSSTAHCSQSGSAGAMQVLLLATVFPDSGGVWNSRQWQEWHLSPASPTVQVSDGYSIEHVGMRCSFLSVCAQLAFCFLLYLLLCSLLAVGLRELSSINCLHRLLCVYRCSLTVWWSFGPRDLADGSQSVK